MFVYLFLEALNFIHGRLWHEMAGGWGAWYLVEVVGFVAVPMVLLLVGATKGNLKAVKIGAILGLLGVILNRLNVSVIAFRWNEAAHYVPSWMEIVVTAGVICAEIWVFRWVVRRLPVLGHRPAWAEEPEAPAQARRLPNKVAV